MSRPRSADGAENAARYCVTCWICGSTHVSQWKRGTLDGPIRPEDLRITDAAYGVTWPMHKCSGCGFVFAASAVSADLVSLYNQMSDSEYEEGHATRVLQMRWLLAAALRQHPEARTLLDVGAATGLLVAEARRSGLEAVGVEPSAALVSTARGINQADVLHGVLPHPALNGRRFDLVCLVDVLEHVVNPLQLLRDAKAMLNPDGLLLVVTPDISSLAARMLGPRWWHYRPAHVCFLDRQSMGTASAEAGLSVRKCFRAKWFFPVGYLAARLERYLPIARLNRAAPRFKPLAWVYRLTIPLDLHDSSVFMLAHRVQLWLSDRAKSLVPALVWIREGSGAYVEPLIG
jgi:SAM-dependent methyltransferase